MTVTVAVVVADVSSKTVGIEAGLNVLRFVRSEETFAALIAVWPDDDVRPAVAVRRAHVRLVDHGHDARRRSGGEVAEVPGDVRHAGADRRRVGLDGDRRRAAARAARRDEAVVVERVRQRVAQRHVVEVDVRGDRDDRRVLDGVADRRRRAVRRLRDGGAADADRVGDGRRVAGVRRRGRGALAGRRPGHARRGRGDAVRERVAGDGGVVDPHPVGHDEVAVGRDVHARARDRARRLVPDRARRARARSRRRRAAGCRARRRSASAPPARDRRWSCRRRSRRAWRSSSSSSACT